MTARIHEAKQALFDPIPVKIKPEWDQLIETSKALVRTNDNARWKLLLISSEVGKKYGEALIERWAMEIGISIRSAREYRQLSKYGVGSEFIDEWSSKLSYTQIRYFVLKHKSVMFATPYLEEMAQRTLRQDEMWAKESFSGVTDKDISRTRDELKPISQKLEKSVDQKLISSGAALQFTKLLERVQDPEVINSLQHHVLIDDELLTEFTDSLRDKDIEQLEQDLIAASKDLAKLYSLILKNKNRYEILLAMRLETTERNQTYSSYEFHAKIEKLAKLAQELSTIEPEPITDDVVVPVPLALAVAQKGAGGAVLQQK